MLPRGVLFAVAVGWLVVGGLRELPTYYVLYSKLNRGPALSIMAEVVSNIFEGANVSPLFILDLLAAWTTLTLALEHAKNKNPPRQPAIIE